MRILQINTESTWRGGERQTLYTIQGLIEAGEEVGLLCRRNAPLHAKANQLGIAVHAAGSAPGAIAFLASEARKYDILHAQTARTQSLAVLTRPLHKRPIVYSRRVDFAPHGWFARWKYGRTDRVVAISSAIRDILQRFGANEVKVIPDMIRRRELDSDRAHQQLANLRIEGKCIVATVSAFVPHKDPQTMLRAVLELKQLREDFVFLHFGDGPLRAEMESRVRENELGDVYRFMGHLENVEDFFSVFDVFIMSSREEGLGSSVLDAFLYGVPVVSTEAGGLKELVEGCGLLCPIGDPECLASSIHRILNEKELRESLIAEAAQRVKEHFVPEPLVQEYLELYRSLRQRKQRN